MAELVDATDSKPVACKGVRVRVSLPAHMNRVSSIELAYVVGVALGDGNLSNPNGRATRLRITCDAKYPKIAKEIKQALEAVFPTNKVSVVPRADTYFDLSVYSNKLNSLVPWKVGKGPKKKQRASVPNWIYSHSKYMKACLKGLIQTDGCIYTDRGYKMINFTSNTKQLAEAVHRMIVLLGYRPTFSTVINAGFKKYTVRIARKLETRSFVKLLSLYKA